MLSKISEYRRSISLGFSLTLLLQIASTSISYAGTGDDSQTEYSSPGGGGGEMVNMYNGALNYTIPLMTIPGQNIGYDITLSYNSDQAKMLNDASFVGFGWALNLGSISRTVQAVPDDFNKDSIQYFLHTKPFESIDMSVGKLSGNENMGLSIGAGGEGAKEKNSDKFSGNIYWDNYSGIGLRIGINQPIKTGSGADEKTQGSVGLELDTKRGIGYSLSKKFGYINLSVSGNLNSGMSGINLGYSGIGYSASTGILFNSMVAPQSMPMRTTSRTGAAKLGFGFIPTSAPIANGTFDMSKLYHENKGIFGSFTGTYINSIVRTGTYLAPAYGYLYRSEEKEKLEDSLYNELNYHSVRDFIRYPLSYKKGTEFLPASQLGTDIFIQSDQGSGGAFSARTERFEAWSQTDVTSLTRTYNLAGEFSIDSITTNFQAGVDFMSGKGVAKTGLPDSNFYRAAGFHTFLSNNERTPLIKGSEIHIEKEGESALDSWEDHLPTRIQLQKGNPYTMLNQQVGFGAGVPDHERQEDFKQQSYVQYFTTEDALQAGRSRNFGYLKSLNSEKINDRRHHIAEINVWETNGLVYTYCEPVYNKKRVDAMFSLENEGKGTFGEGVKVNEFEKALPSGNKTKNGDITYGKAKSLGGGLHAGSEMLNVSILPEYATAWPVSMITSRNYFDVTGNGPSNDDIGSWMKFEYSRNIDNYQWRMPYNNVQVTDGVKGESGDDVGFYRFGVKELKYIQRIESKTHVAKFHYSSRNDCYSVESDTEGGKSGYNPTLKLDSVRLFLKRNDTPTQGDSTLIQTVCFKYNYELVPGEPSNAFGEGKLTLKQVYTTFYNSSKGQNYKYSFDYGDVNDLAINPSYNRANLDRWGNYKRNKTETSGGVFSDTYAKYPFQDFPYTEEARDTVNDNLVGEPAPWCLRKIHLPTGSSMEIDYEHRDYAYVEAKEATKMYDIVSVDDFYDIGDLSNISPTLSAASNRNISSGGYSEDDLFFKDYVTVKLPASEFQHMNSTKRNQYFYDNYIKGIEDELYIKAYVKLDANSHDEKGYGYVELMARIDEVDPYIVHEVSGEFYGVIKLDRVYMQLDYKSALSPCLLPEGRIRAAAIDHIKVERNDIYYGGVGDFDGVNPAAAIEKINAALTGMTCALRADDYADAIRLNGWSKIRLKQGNGKKIGGGYRVKTVTLNDNWKGENSDESYSYKQKYTYTMLNDSGDAVISSGVAVEPLVGREENADYKLYYYQEELPLAENNTRHISGHPLDFHNTGVGVGYSKVTVENVYDVNFPLAEMKKSIAPHTEYEFFTPREFPFIKRATTVSLQDDPYKRFLAIPQISTTQIEDNAVAQGYSVVKNDMAGKLKSIKQLTREGSVISGQEYKYFEGNDALVDQGYSSNFKSMDHSKVISRNHLKNDSIITLNSGIGSPSDKLKAEYVTIGEDYDIWIDMNQNSDITNEHGWVEFNIDLTTASPYFLGLMPIILMPENVFARVNREVITNKVIYRRGILKEVNTIKNQSKIRTEYLAYDQETAAPLLTRVDNEWHNTHAQNELRDSINKEPRIYKLTRPAYWEYRFEPTNQNKDLVYSNPFQGAYKTIDKEFKNIGVGTGGALDIPQGDLSDGDIVMYQYYDTTYIPGYIQIGDDSVLFLWPDVDTLSRIGYVNKYGTPGNYNYRLYDSAYATIENTSFDYLRVIQSGNSNLINSSVGEIVFKKLSLTIGDTLIMDDYLNVSAITFADGLGKYCCVDFTGGALKNPYINGQRNYFMPSKSFVFHNPRQYSDSSYSQRGLLQNYTPFNWQLDSGYHWVLSSQAIKYDFWGNLLEQRNALGLYSTSSFGHQESAVVGSVSNSRRYESGSENFETTEEESCVNSGRLGVGNDLSIDSGGDYDISTQRAHTGSHSLRVSSGKKFVIEKEVTCEPQQ